LKPFGEPKTFAALVRQTWRRDWVVYAKRPFGGPEHVLRYLGGYTHRVAISNHRLLAFEQGRVTFRWRDSAHKNRKRRMTLAVDEFLRRFLLHLLPRGFVRIRNFGFLANRHRSRLLPLCGALLGAAAPDHSAVGSASANAREFWACPLCRAPMQIVERFTALELRVRPPPEARVTL
jgi:hypothetical protein